MIWFKVMITCVIVLLCLMAIKTICFEDVPAAKIPKVALLLFGIPLLVALVMIPVSLLAIVWTT